MDNTEIILTILTSTVISSVVTIILDTYIKLRVTQKYSKELEEIKSGLSIQSEIIGTLAKRKLESYPIIADYVYRCRNMARDLSTNPVSSIAFIDELALRTSELETIVSQNRLDLQRDGIYLRLHEYKGHLRNFIGMIGQVNNQSSKKPKSERARILKSLKDYYSPVDQIHKILIEELANKEIVNDPFSKAPKDKSA